MFTQLYVKASTLMTEFKNDERGVTAIEYGLIAVAMAAVLGVVFGGGVGGGDIGKALKAVFDSITTALGGTPTT
ncbi:Flp family type IVb pilin [Vibrio methylphosphonaticus]|uniref:Flp family type IVb pilin n=1 Tax=Vibrio methylphosphonaticus TaxID=2946866 RepID=UPI00202A05CC|nr:Flp family type IVb pilin [Vibrio methylphosphonaticus]MCL9774877.1 Flp family type IVb pilin [Vibrio methylphosphonaticus]